MNFRKWNSTFHVLSSCSRFLFFFFCLPFLFLYWFYLYAVSFYFLGSFTHNTKQQWFEWITQKCIEQLYLGYLFFLHWTYLITDMCVHWMILFDNKLSHKYVLLIVLSRRCICVESCMNTERGVLFDRKVVSLIAKVERNKCSYLGAQGCMKAHWKYYTVCFVLEDFRHHRSFHDQ